MTENAPSGVFEYLEAIEKQDGSKKPTFRTFKDFIEYKARKQGVPLYGQFELTPLCNLNCKMCYTHLTKEQMRGKGLLTVEQWKRLMWEAWEAGMMNATLTGGECLAYPGFEELYLFLRGLGCEITVLTNGVLLDEKWVSFFKANRPEFLQVSLYGGDEDTYERVTGHRKFAVVMENIHRALAEGLPITMAVTESRYMGDGIYDTLRAVKSLGFKCSINDRMTDPKEETGRSGQQHGVDVDEYVKVCRFINELNGVETTEIPPEKLPPPGGPHRECGETGLTCRAGLSGFILEWDGTLYACNSIRDIWAKPLEDGFRAAWNSIHQKCLQWPRIPECIDCPYSDVCTNCMYEKSRFAEPGKQPLALCERTRYLVQRGVRRAPACE